MELVRPPSTKVELLEESNLVCGHVVHKVPGWGGVIARDQWKEDDD